MNGQSNSPAQVFISYAREDNDNKDPTCRWLNRVLKHLNPLTQQEILCVWSDEEIKSGETWEQRLMEKLQSAKIAILLLSPAFLASRYIREKELPVLLENAMNGKTVIIPVHLKPSVFSVVTYKFPDPETGPNALTLDRLQAQNKPGDALIGIDEYQQEQILSSVARRIIEIVKGVSIESSIDVEAVRSGRFLNFPISRNLFFTGREKIFEQLHAILTNSGAAALNGMGGIGKTQIAAEYAYRYQNEYRYILWVRADSNETILSDFMAIGHLLSLPIRSDDKKKMIIGEIKRWLEDNASYLLILDNADDLQLVRNFIPTPAKGHLLYTTRAHATGDVAQSITVGKMQPSEGALLLLRRAKFIKPGDTIDMVGEFEQANADRILKEVDGHPLAIDQVGAFIEETNVTLANYLELYSNIGQKLRDRRGEFSSLANERQEKHPDSVTATFSIAFSNLRRACPKAANLICLCAFLHPDGIPERLISELICPMPHGLLNSLKGIAAIVFLLLYWVLKPSVLVKYLLPQSIAITWHKFRTITRVESQTDSAEVTVNITREACRFSLVQCDQAQKIITIHRLVQAVIQDKLSNRVKKYYAKKSIIALNNIFPDQQVLNPEKERVCEELIPHVLTCVPTLKKLKIHSPAALSLIRKAGEYFEYRGQYSQAEQLFKLTLDAEESLLGADHPHMLQTLRDLSLTYYRLDKLKEGEDIANRALSIAENTKNLSYQEDIVNNLGLLALGKGRYMEAENKFRQALSLADKSSNIRMNFPHVLCYNLAKALFIQGRIKEAEIYLNDLQKKDIAHDEHSNIEGFVLALISNILVYKGEYDEACQIKEKAYATIEQKYGEKNPVTIDTLSSLALAYAAGGRFEKAEQLFLNALTLADEVFGAEHTKVASILNCLANAYASNGRHCDAKPLFKRAREIIENAFGTDHPFIADCLIGLANADMEAGNHKKADSNYRNAIKLLKAATGTERLNTAKAYNGMAQNYAIQGEQKKATHFFKQDLKLKVKFLGPKNLELIKSLDGLIRLQEMEKPKNKSEKVILRSRALELLGTECSEKCQFIDAVNFYQHALYMRESVQGSEHQAVVDCLMQLAKSMERLSLYDDAEQYYKRAMVNVQEINGPEHIETTKVQYELAHHYIRKGDYDKAITILWSIAARYKALFNRNSIEVASILDRLAILHQIQGLYQEAGQLAAQADEICLEILGEESPKMANRLFKKADFCLSLGHFEAAKKLYEKAYKIWCKNRGTHVSDIVTCLNKLSYITRLQHSYKRAEQYCHEVLQFQVEHILDPVALSDCLLSMAQLHNAQRRYDKAEQDYRKSISTRRKKTGHLHPDIAYTYCQLGNLCQNIHNRVDSTKYFSKALNIYQDIYGYSHPDVAAVLYRLSELSQIDGFEEQAMSLYQQSLNIRESIAGLAHFNTRETFYERAQELNDNASYEQAKNFFYLVLADLDKDLGSVHLLKLRCLSRIADIHKSQGGYDSAIELYERTLSGLEKMQDPEPSDMHRNFYNLALAYLKRGDTVEAELCFRKALDIREKLLGREHPDVAACLSNLALIYEAQGKKEDSERIYQQSMTAWENLKTEKVIVSDVVFTVLLIGPIAAMGGAILGSILGLITVGVGGAFGGAFFGGVMCAVMLSTVFSLFEIDENFGTAVFWGIIGGVIWWLIFGAIADGLSGAIDGIFFGAVIGAVVSSVGVVIKHVVVRALVGGFCGLFFAGMMAFLLSGLYESTGLGIFETVAQWEYAHIVNAILRDFDSILFIFGHSKSWLAAGVLFGLAGGVFIAELKEPVFVYDRIKKLRSQDFDTLYTIALLWKNRGFYKEAEQLYKHALSIQEKKLNADHPDIAASLFELAHLHQMQGRYYKAKHQLKRVLSIRKKVFGLEHLSVTICLRRLAVIYMMQGRYTVAIQLCGQAKSLQDSFLDPDHPEQAACLKRLAEIYERKGDCAKALQFYNNAQSIWEKGVETGNDHLYECLYRSGIVSTKLGQYEDAIEFFDKALGIKKMAFGEDHPDVAACLSNIAVVQDMQGLHEDAEGIYERAFAISEKARKQRYAISEILDVSVFLALLGGLAGAILGAILGLIEAGGGGVIGGTIFGLVFGSVLLMVLSVVTHIDEELFTSIIGAFGGIICWVVFGAIAYRLSGAIDGIFFGIVFGAIIFGFGVVAKRKSIGALLGVVCGIIMSAAFNFLSIGLSEAVRQGIFETIIQGRSGNLLDALPMHLDQVLILSKDSIIWIIAGALTGSLFGLAGAAAATDWKDQVADLLDNYRGLRKIHPEEAETIYHLGLALENRGILDYEENAEKYYRDAIDMFGRALKALPHYSDAYCHRGITRVRLRNIMEDTDESNSIKEGLADLNRAIELDPEYEFAIVWRGWIYVELERFSEAIKDFDSVLKKHPKKVSALIDRAWSYYSIKRYDEAIFDVESVMEIDPNNADAQYLCGVVYNRMQRYGEAVRACTQALELQADYDSALAERAGAYAALGRHDEALSDLKRCLKTSPDNHWYLYMRGVVYLLKVCPDEAREDFSRASQIAEEQLKYNPKDWRCMFNLMLYHAANDNLALSKEILMDAVSKGATNHRIQVAIDDVRDFLSFFPEKRQLMDLQQQLSECIQ